MKSSESCFSDDQCKYVLGSFLLEVLQDVILRFGLALFQQPPGSQM